MQKINPNNKVYDQDKLLVSLKRKCEEVQSLKLIIQRLEQEVRIAKNEAKLVIEENKQLHLTNET